MTTMTTVWLMAAAGWYYKQVVKHLFCILSNGAAVDGTTEVAG